MTDKLCRNTLRMDLTSKTQESNGKHRIRPPEKGVKSTTMEMGDSEDLEKAQDHVDETLRLLNLFIDKADDVNRLEFKASKEFNKALEGGDEKLANEILDKVRGLRIKKKMFNDRISWMSEDLDELEDVISKVVYVEDLKDHIKQSLSDTKRRRCHLEFMTKHTARIFVQLESAIEEHKDMKEAELYLSKHRSLVKPFQQS